MFEPFNTQETFFKHKLKIPPIGQQKRSVPQRTFDFDDAKSMVKKQRKIGLEHILGSP